MDKNLKIFTITIIIFISTLVAYQFAYSIGEKYFFDKLFYQKSIAHGYLVKDKNDYNLEKYGVRSENLTGLMYTELSENKNVLGNSSNDNYTIAIIGDSLVWGVGVKDTETFSQILGKQLNKIRNTKVLQLGFPGDSLIDNYSKYLLVNNQEKIDLYIFLIVENDLLFHKEGRYLPSKYEEFVSLCNEVPIDVTLDHAGAPTTDDDYHTLLEKSFNNPKNLCLAEKTLTLFPKENSIFLQIAPDLKYIPSYTNFQDILNKSSLNLLSTNEGKKISKYDKYWQDFYRQSIISKKERHPSKTSHSMFADILFGEITQNARWKFNSKN